MSDPCAECGSVEGDVVYDGYGSWICRKCWDRRARKINEVLLADLPEQARALLRGDRQDDYGDPAENWRRIAAGWSAIFGIDISPKQAVLAMAVLKCVREAQKPKADNRVDAVAYLLIAEELT